VNAPTEITRVQNWRYVQFVCCEQTFIASGTEMCRFDPRSFCSETAAHGQVVHTQVPLSALFIKQCNIIPAKGGDVLRLGR